MGLLRRLTVSALTAAAAACDHTAPFSVGNYGSTAPLNPGNPVQLTYNLGVDTRASWLPDGSAFLYTQEELDTPDRDRCLALMRAGGGGVTRTICDLSDLGHDSLDDFESAAVNSAARIAYLRTSMIEGIGRVGPDAAALVVAPFGNPTAATVLQSLPYVGSDSTGIDLVSDVHWVGLSTLVYLAEQASYSCINMGCTALDTTRAGVEIDRVDLSSAGPIRTMVPNTTQATSVASGGPDTIYYTLNGDLGVHRRILSTGSDTVVVTLAAAPTDVTVAGALVAAVVGDDVQVVNVQTSTASTLSLSSVHLQHPALSPDGKSLVADVVIGGNSPDLWLWRLP